MYRIHVWILSYISYYGYASTTQTVDDQFHRRPARVQRSGCLYACRSTCLMTTGVG